MDGCVLKLVLAMWPAAVASVATNSRFRAPLGGGWCTRGGKKLYPALCHSEAQLQLLLTRIEFPGHYVYSTFRIATLRRPAERPLSRGL
jgi:hypothetical protein